MSKEAVKRTITRKTMNNIVNRLEREGYEISAFTFAKTEKNVRIVIEGGPVTTLFDRGRQ